MKKQTELLKDLQAISEILLKYGDVVFENGLVKNDPDPRKALHHEYVFKLTVNPNKK